MKLFLSAHGKSHIHTSDYKHISGCQYCQHVRRSLLNTMSLPGKSRGRLDSKRSSGHKSTNIQQTSGYKSTNTQQPSGHKSTNIQHNRHKSTNTQNSKSSFRQPEKQAIHSDDLSDGHSEVQGIETDDPGNDDSHSPKECQSEVLIVGSDESQDIHLNEADGQFEVQEIQSGPCLSEIQDTNSKTVNPDFHTSDDDHGSNCQIFQSVRPPNANLKRPSEQQEGPSAKRQLKVRPPDQLLQAVPCPDVRTMTTQGCQDIGHSTTVEQSVLAHHQISHPNISHSFGSRSNILVTGIHHPVLKNCTRAGLSVIQNPAPAGNTVIQNSTEAVHPLIQISTQVDHNIIQNRTSFGILNPLDKNPNLLCIMPARTTTTTTTAALTTNGKLVGPSSQNLCKLGTGQSKHTDTNQSTPEVKAGYIFSKINLFSSPFLSKIYIFFTK